jgi:putative ABC transport system substrate-binding protein
LAIVHRELIITLAARYRLPAVYFYRFFVTAGGLISYGPDSTDQFRRAAGYVRRGVIIPWVNLSVTGNGGPCQR